MLRLENLHKAYGDKVVLDHASFHFPDGERIALVGDNGEGKTTLLRLICNLEAQDNGEVVTTKETYLGYLPQTFNPNPKSTILDECLEGHEEIARLHEKMQAMLKILDESHSHEAMEAFTKAEDAYRLKGGYELEAKAKGILIPLGFRDETLANDPRGLSGGWRMRLEMAKLFIKPCNVLILDEPTNHLDLPSLVWVENFLTNYDGTLIFVSHDRALLNRLATMCLHLQKGRLTPYKGNFDAFLVTKQEREELAQKQFSGIEKEKEKLTQFIDRFGAKASKAAQAQSKAKLVEKLSEQQQGISLAQRNKTIHFSLNQGEKSGRVVLQIKDGSIGYSYPLASKIQMQIERGQKIAIIGANGIGKSTFLKTIAGKIAKLHGEFDLPEKTRFAYFSQEQLDTLKTEDTVMDNLISISNLGERDARQLLGSFLFNKDDVYKKVKVLSGGEKSRLALACVLAQKANFLLLDEPTNHLDMASVDELTDALKRYEGTLLFVSHDRTFIDALSSHVFAMTHDGKSMLFNGHLTDYERLAPLSGFPNILALPSSDDPTQKLSKQRVKQQVVEPEIKSGGDLRKERKEKNKNAKKIQQLEESMESVKVKVGEMEKEMSKLTNEDYIKLMELQDKKDTLVQELHRIEEEWLELS